MVRFNDNLSYSCKSNEMEATLVKKGVLNANKFNVLSFVLSKIKYLLLRLQNVVMGAHFSFGVVFFLA